jgi:hypothetical protein
MKELLVKRHSVTSALVDGNMMNAVGVYDSEGKVGAVHIPPMSHVQCDYPNLAIYFTIACGILTIAFIGKMAVLFYAKLV